MIGLETGELIAVLLGIIGSTTIHLSQGLMRLGIARRQASPTSRTDRTYLVGLALNLTAPFWVILANRYAPTIFFTSMYAIGLIPLLLFSCLKLGESLKARHIAGAILLTAGAALLAIEQGTRTRIPMFEVQIWIISLVGAAWLLAAPVVAIAVKRRSYIRSDLVFGFLGGGFLALDSIFKGVAQAGPEGSDFLPQSPQTWVLFLLSFLGAIGALGMTQWAHHNRYRASVVIAGYDMAYVSLPYMLVPFAALQPRMSLPDFLGMVLLVSGIWLIIPTMTYSHLSTRAKQRI